MSKNKKNEYPFALSMPLGPLFRKAAISAYTPALVAIAYYLGAEAAFYAGTLSDRIFAPFWPPNIILFCALLLVPTDRWWLFILAIFPAHVVAEVGIGMPAVQYMIAFASNCMVAILSAYGVRRWAPGPPWFANLRQALIYLLISVVASPALSALGGAFVQISGGGPIKDYWIYWANWYSANALAAATLGPVFLTWKDTCESSSALPRGKKIEALILLLVLTCGSLITFGVGPKTTSSEFLPTLLYLPMPFITWGALRFGARGASSAIFIVAIFAIWGILRGSAFFNADSPGANVLTLQVFLTTLASPAILLGAAIEELHRARNGLQDLASSLLRIQDDERRHISKALHEQIGQDLAAAHLAVGRLERTTGPSFAAVIEEIKRILRRSIDEIRAVSQLLYPPLLDESGLTLALKSYIGRLSRRRGVEFNLMLSPEFGRFPADIEFVLFRVIQETVTNVHHHSGSPLTLITLACEGKSNAQKIAITIQDVARTGEIDASSSTPLRIAGPQELASAGLAELHERLRQLGGSVHVEATLGTTFVTVFVPTTRRVVI